MANVFALLTSTLSRLAAPSPTLDAPLPREAREMADAPRDRAAERAARDYEESRAALLPSTGYRTNPRPASVVTLHHGWTGGGAALPWLCGSGPADTSHPR